MEPLIWMALSAIGGYALNLSQQRQRIALLARELGPFQIEKQLETLTEGYLRGLAEDDLLRRQQIWDLLAPAERSLADQFGRFATAFARVDAAHARISTLPWSLPFADRLLSQATFDVRQVFAVHARGLAAAVENKPQRTPRDKAFTLMAEMLLMQHTCHWFCRSRHLADLRTASRHRTSHAQIVAAVSPETRSAYLALVGH